jgi:hypothetical protein
MTSANARSLDLLRLLEGIPALSVGARNSMMEACMICFESRGHKSGVELKVQGSFVGTFTINWRYTITDNMRHYWQDEGEATEYAAYGIALLLIEELTGYTALQRANKGFGFDFWLGYNDEKLLVSAKRQARLEVSGIRQGNRRQILSRVRQKLAQTDVSNGQHPAYVAVVEFGTPMAQVVTK